MKKRMALILIVIVLASLLGACQPTARGPAPIEEPVTLIFIIPSEYRRLYEPAVEKFKLQEPNITIDMRIVGFSANGGDVALIRWFQNGPGGPTDTVEPLDLMPFLQQDKNFDPADYLPGALEAFTEGGKLTILPTGADPFVVFYNQDLFDALGVSHPHSNWTWDEFRTTALQISDPDMGLYGYVPSDFYVDSLIFAFQNGGIFAESGTGIRLDGIETIQAVEWYAGLFGSGGAAPNEAQMQDAYGEGGRTVGIVTSKAGMWIDPLSSLSSELGGLVRFEVGIAPLPRGQQGFSLVQYEGLMISAQSSNPDAAWRWVSFLAEQPVTWVYPTRISIAESKEFTDAFGEEQSAAVRDVIASSNALTGLDFEGFETTIFQFLSAVRQIVDGGTPVQETLRNAQENTIQP